MSAKFMKGSVAAMKGSIARYGERVRQEERKSQRKRKQWKEIKKRKHAMFTLR